MIGKQGKKRLANFDVLRCLAMFMIILIHFFGHGMKHASISGDFCFQLNTPVGGINYIVSQIIYVLSLTAVDLFVFITGYFSISKQQLRLGKLAKLWVEVVFYSVTISAIFYFSLHSISRTDLLKSLLPIRSSQYWFFTSYFGLMLLSPFLSKIAGQISHKSYVVGLLALSFITLDFYKFPYAHQYGNDYGTSLLFFVLLYYVGGYFRLYGNMLPTGWIHISNVNHKNALMLAIVTALVCVLGMIKGIDFTSMRAITVGFPYHSFTLLVAIAFFQFFANLHFNNNKFVKLSYRIAPYTFAVYLIHDHPLLRDFLWHHLIRLDAILNQPYYLLELIGIPTIIFITCVIIDAVREHIFKLLHFHHLFKNNKLEIDI